jgi:hypothetical protein
MTKSMKAGIWSALVAVAASAGLVACGGGGEGGGGGGGAPATGSGTLRVALTDSPACGYDQVNVTVERVRVHTSMAANDSDMGWTDIAVSAPRKINLLDLQNGAIAELGQATLPAGTYTQIRLVLGANRGGSPANSVVPTGGSELPLDTPSAQQSGLKLINGFTVKPGELTDIVIDFDACKSIVTRGNGSYGLKPVMQMMPRTGAAIAGFIEAGVNGATVTAQKNGVVLRATQPTSTGQFLLAPVDPAQTPYDVVFTAPDRTTAVIASVPVVLNQTTSVGAVGNPVTMPVSAMSSVSGKLLPLAAQATGSVRALQKVGSVAAVEVAHTNVNATTGEYTLNLSLAAPRFMLYSTGNVTANPMPFGAQTADAALFKLEGAATGFAPNLGAEFTLTSTAITGKDITLVPVGP